MAQASKKDQNNNAGFQFIADLCEELSSDYLEIPSFPDNALRIKNALNEPDITADRVARLVSLDPIFSARLLKVANSVMINGAGVPISDIRTAITRMGFKQAQNTVIAVAIEQVLKSPVSKAIRPYLDDLWHHSVQVAAYSYVIANRQTTINPDEAMLAGLLHDIGKFYILARADSYPELFHDTATLEDIIDEWHTGVGRSIIESWGFSEEFAQVADEHEVPDRVINLRYDLVDIVMIANLFAHDAENDEQPSIEWDCLRATRRLGLDEEVANEILDESKEEIQSLLQAFTS